MRPIEWTKEYHDVEEGEEEPYVVGSDHRRGNPGESVDYGLILIDRIFSGEPVEVLVRLVGACRDTNEFAFDVADEPGGDT